MGVDGFMPFPSALAQNETQTIPFPMTTTIYAKYITCDINQSNQKSTQKVNLEKKWKLYSAQIQCNTPVA